MSLNTHSIDLERDSTQYLSITDGSQTGLDITGDFTIELWVKLESAPATDTYRPFVSKWLNTGNQRSYAVGYINLSDTMYLYGNISTNGTAATSGTVAYTLNAGTYYHLAFTYDASAGTMEVFVDDSSVGTISSLATSIYNGTAAFQIGYFLGETFDGLIDEVRVWSDIRTSTEISDNRSVELVGDEANLVAYWQLDNDLLDMTANNNDLTNNGSAVFSTTVPFAGSAGSAIKTTLGLAQASVKTVDGLAIANMKTWDGLA